MNDPGPTTRPEDGVSLHDQEPAVRTMQADVLAGLRSSPKYLPSQYLYDERGARLFERICEQPEYYLTRTETAIMESNMEAIAASIGPGALLIEPGSGDGTKSVKLLEGLHQPSGYVPIDISRTQLVELAERVAERFPEVEVAPVCADFTHESFDVPPVRTTESRSVAFLPGSTIGNFDPDTAADVLRDLRRLSGEEGCVLVGVDLRKDRDIIEPAYDDARGVSRDFALNYLHRLNRELGADFEPAAFGYEAPYDPHLGRVEMSLVSREEQSARIGAEEIDFAPAERVRTEYSYKYDQDSFRELAGKADLAVERVWTDPEQLFSVQLLVAS